ncbi:MAG: beta-ketoacyl-[acyl-carrier-protein] synthase family protein [Candidatus Lambdaproteobacteria bacterium]|nr:beta-ketoacyl-[acyl-carrier-protein] synthase family protein [Candidatus Lambdaproteobacteria bacterium]
MDNVAITGMGVISSLGQNLEDFNRKLTEGFVAVGPTPWNDQPHFKDYWVSLIEGFKPEDWMEGRVVRGTATFAQYAIAAAVQAVEDAGITEFDPERTAVIIGSCMSGVDAIADEQYKLDKEGPQAVDGKFQLRNWPNMPAGHIALRWGLHGPQLAISTACASSHDAMGYAARMIEAGEVDVAITGGSDSGRSQVYLAATGNYGMFTPQPDPYKTCRPFNAERFGIMSGEGAGMFVLERAEKAKKRGARIHGMLRGYATLADAYHPSSPEPNGKWEQRAMELALQSAHLPGGADDIDAVVAHGTGTPVGDVAEIKALNRIYGKRSEPIPVTAPKGNFGHPGGPAGALGLLVGMHSMQQNAVMATAGTHDVKDLMPEVGRVRVVLNEPAPTRIDAIQVNAFGFGGQNSSMIVTRK